MSGLIQDLRYALRQMRKKPGFAATAIITLALGIGANTAVFTMVQSVLLAPLKYPQPDRIVALNTHFSNTGRKIPRMTGGDFTDVRAQATDFAALTYYQGGELGVQLRDHATFVGVMWTNSDYAKVLGVQPVVGRFFRDDEAERSAVVDSAFAQQNFGTGAAALGQTLSVEGKVYNVVGVISAGTGLPSGTHVWLGAPLVPRDQSHDAFNFHAAIARLRPGVSLDAVQAQLSTISTRLQTAYPVANRGKSFIAVPLHEQLVVGVRPALMLLTGAVALVLLIACVNVAHLQLARATTRFRELALRTALGASRWQIARQVLAETLVLAFAGGLAGLGVAVLGLRVLIRMAPADTPMLSDVHLSAPVLAFTFGLSLLATLLSGLAPASHVLRINLTDALKQDASRGLTGQGVSTLRSSLVVGEVALTFLLAIAAGLLGRTLYKLSEVDLGFRAQRLLVVYAHAPANGEAQYIEKDRELARLQDDLGHLPGVEQAASVMGLPAGQYGSNGGYIAEGSGLDENSQLGAATGYATFSLSSPQYFETLGISFLAGRDFQAADDFGKPGVAIISESLAKQSFPGQNSIGKRIRCGLDPQSMHWMTIVGVVGDVRQDSPASEPGPAIYMPLAQHPYYANEVQIVLRTSVPPLSLMDTVARKIRATDPEIATKFTTLDLMLDESVATQRFRAVLIGAFAALGLALAMVGVYGVIGYMVSQRTFEVGVRLTFGADQADIWRMILRQALSLTVCGVIAGLIASVFVMRLVSSMLFHVPPHDPWTYAGVIVLLLCTAVLAAYVPARRAAAVDPIKALRYE